jgi:hypothetical protein
LLKAILQDAHALLHASTLEEEEEEADEVSVLFPTAEVASVLVEVDAESVLLPELAPDEDASVLVPVADAAEDASVLVALDALSVLVVEDEVPSVLVEFEALDESAVLDVAAGVDADEAEELLLSELDELELLELELELELAELEELELLDDVVSRMRLALREVDQAEPEFELAEAEPPGAELRAIESALAGDELVRSPES